MDLIACISLLASRIIFANWNLFHRYFINTYFTIDTLYTVFQPSQHLVLPVFSHSTARHFSTLCSRYLSKYRMRFSLAKSWFNKVRMYACTGILMSTYLCEEEDSDNGTSSKLPWARNSILVCNGTGLELQVA